MRIKIAATLVAMLVMTSASVAGCTSAASAGPSGSSAASLVSATCSKCHPIARVKAACHDAAGWTVTITRMRQAHGVPIDDAAAQKIIAFLANGGASQL